MSLYIKQTNIYTNGGFCCPPPPMMMGGPCCGYGMGSIWSKDATYGALTGIAAGIIIGSPKIRHAIGSAATAVWNGVLKPVGKFIWNGVLKPVGKFIWNGVLKPVGKFIGNVFSGLFKGIKSLFTKKDKSQKAE